MPTVFYIKASKPNLNLGDIAKSFASNSVKKPPLLNGCQIIINPSYYGIIIHLPHVFCFSADIVDLAVKILSDYIEKIGLTKIFSSGKEVETSSIPYTNGIPQPPSYYKREPLFTITIILKDKGISLYRDHNNIANDISGIADTMQNLFPGGEKWLIDKIYDSDKERYYLHFMNLVKPQDFLLFQGDYVWKAIKLKNLDAIFAIEGFDLEAYYKHTMMIKNKENNIATNIISSQLQSETEKKEDAILYGETAETISKPSSEDGTIQKETIVPINTLTKNFSSIMINATSTVEQKLFQAAASNNPTLLRIFVKQVSNINVKDSITGRTALHVAVINKAVTCIPILVKSGADHTIPDNDGKTALDYANVAEDKKVLTTLNSAIKSQQSISIESVNASPS